MAPGPHVCHATLFFLRERFVLFLREGCRTSFVAQAGVIRRQQRRLSWSLWTRGIIAEGAEGREASVQLGEQRRLRTSLRTLLSALSTPLSNSNSLNTRRVVEALLARCHRRGAGRYIREKVDILSAGRARLRAPGPSRERCAPQDCLHEYA